MENLVFSNNKVSIKGTLLDDIIYLLKNFNNHNEFDKYFDQEELNISSSEFKNMLGVICEKSFLYIIISNNRIQDDESNFKNAEEKFKKLFDKNIEKFNKFKDWESNLLDEKLLVECISLSKKIYIDYKNLILFYNFVLLKDELIKDLKYYKTEDEIEQFSKKYDNLLKINDIDKLQEMVDEEKSEIKEIWLSYITNLDDIKETEQFNFLGHTTYQVKYDGEFNSKYVSTSLFNKDFNKGYSSDYGFILNPKGIIGADSTDMYISNNATDKELIYSGGIIPIKHPQRIIDECYEYRKINEQNKIIYSEILIDKFEPIGIFCFTNGSKTLDENYVKAKKLQEQYSNLKIIEIDVMKTKDYNHIIEKKYELLKSIELASNNSKEKIISNDNINLDNFKIFFKQYETLKKLDNYNEQQIIELYNRYLKILNGKISKEEIFSGKYNEEEIKLWLDNKYLIPESLNKPTAYLLNKIKNSLKETPVNLDNYYDGLDDFCNLFPNFKITDDIVKDLNNISFSILNQKIKEELMLKNHTDNLKITELDLSNIKKEYDLLLSIINNQNYLGIIKKEYQELHKSITNNDNTIISKSNEEKKIKEEKNKLVFKAYKLQHSTYTDDEQYISNKNKILELSSDLIKIQNNVINALKKSKVKKEIRTLSEINDQIRTNFDKNKNEELFVTNNLVANYTEKLTVLKVELEILNIIKNKYQEQLETINKKIYEYFKCKNISEIGKKIEYAKKVVEKNRDLVIQIEFIEKDKLKNKKYNNGENKRGVR